MPRLTLILILAWTLLLLPALCTGGWLLHPCDCGSTIGCEHEADCASDPCEIGLARSDSWAQSQIDHSATASTPVVLGDASSNLDPGRVGHRPHPTSRAFRQALPLPPADLPLLI